MRPADAAIRSLWERHRAGVMEQVDAVERAVTTLMRGSLSEAVRAEGEREAHKLAGSLGTFGFHRASELAREIELILAKRGELGAREVPTLSQALVGLRSSLDRAPAPGTIREHVPVDGQASLILIVDDDEELGRRLAAEAVRRGMRADAVLSPQAAVAAVARERPDVVLLDLKFSDGTAGAYDLLSDLTGREPPVPVIALTVSDAFADRVEVARRGGQGFIHKAARAAQAMDAVTDLLHRVRAHETRILAVDDDPVILDTLTTLLASDGLSVTGLDDPARFWDVLEETTPSLVVLDLDMPSHNGLELCGVLRNDSRWAGMPVVFLTAHTDAETVQRIFAAGADDYVAKPIVGPELKVRIQNRVERTQLYRALAETDGLTGIANRRRASEMLVQLMRSADRYDQPLSLAILDLDGFKTANDEFGHAVGDTVLARFGELLRQSFRGEDAVARWGGDEFVIAMQGMSREDGVRRVGELLERFRREEFGTAAQPLQLTFSAGVAQYPEDGADLAGLFQAADEAVYAAKRTRATVVPARRPAGGEAAAAVDVAVVEDDPMVAELLLHALETDGRSARWIRAGDRAAALLSGPAPEVPARVILLDVGLPGLDGLSVLRRLAAEGTLRRAKVIMLTARSAEAEVIQALELGAFDHVAKPFSVPVLLHKLRRALGTRS